LIVEQCQESQVEIYGTGCEECGSQIVQLSIAMNAAVNEACE